MTLIELLDIATIQLKGLSALETPDFRLEQAEYKANEKIWEIVVSYLIENTNKTAIPSAALTSEHQFYRAYKRIKIDKDKNIVGFYIYDSNK
ncbi:hypothetical protein ACXR6G_12980 [Ancylomarina sp. YFZ004]